MKLQFVPADCSDIPVIFTQSKALIDTYEDTEAIDYEKVISWVQHKITKCIGTYQCAILNGEKCGYYRLCEDGELDDLYVLPPFQNRGIGSRILQKCIAESNVPIYLYVFSRNIRAISLYERHGFSVRETVGKTRLIMYRKG